MAFRGASTTYPRSMQQMIAAANLSGVEPRLAA